MKTIAIGDIHGVNTWKTILEKENDFSKIVFVGDYFDSRDNISAADQIANFKEILNLKRTCNNIILLLGNHDFHYIKNVSEHYEGYQPAVSFDIQEVIHDALREDLLQVCHVENDIFFSHAGISKTWCFNTFNKNHFEISEGSTLEYMINESFKYKPNILKFALGINNDLYGNDVTQSPIWIRRESLNKDKLNNFRQVVGHTAINELHIGDITMIDTLRTSNEYLEIINGVMNKKCTKN